MLKGEKVLAQSKRTAPPPNFKIVFVLKILISIFQIGMSKRTAPPPNFKIVFILKILISIFQIGMIIFNLYI
jgi:hypothetical protein